jgi:pimeloyl-ACP methyl ester carboxylesterase
MIAKAIPVIFLMHFILLFSSVVDATGSDNAKEQRWAEQVVDSLLDGDDVWLDDSAGHEFLGILTEGDVESGRAVLLLHGAGVHPNWPDVIYPLRIGLLENDMTSLSIQMPILANDADPGLYRPLFAEVPQRIDAALKFLDESGYRNITLVAHSMGAAMAVYYLSQTPTRQVESLIIIGMSSGLDEVENITRMGQLELPLLDLYGEVDLQAVVASAPERAATGKAASSDYRQQRVSGANHFFQGHESELVQLVIEWLDSTHQQGG